MSKINVLVAVELTSMLRYRENLSTESVFNLNFVPNIEKMFELLSSNKPTDVVVVDNALGDIFGIVDKLRQDYPRLLIITVDEEADFSLPGQADDVSNDPFRNGDLMKKIKRLIEDRRLATLSADSLPSVRSFAKTLMRAKGGSAKTQAAIGAIHDLGYDYVAFFSITPTDPPIVNVTAQAGDNSVTSSAPKKLDYEKSIIGLVAESGESRVVSPEDSPNHPFVSRGRFGAGVGVPVGNNMQFGVVFACRDQPGTISQEDVLMLELVSAQLASALARDAQ
jgi:hypothetical protein